MSSQILLGCRPLSEIQTIVKSDSITIAADIKNTIQEFEMLRQNIMVETQQNMDLDNEIKRLDQMISHHVHQNISVRGIVSHPIHLNGTTSEEPVLNINTKRLYEKMLSILQQEPHFFSSLANLLPVPDSQRLANIIFKVYGDEYDPRLERLILIMFEIMLHQELQSCNQMSTFMRANTPITKLYGVYCKRQQPLAFLRQVLGEELTLLSANSVDLELNPSKVYTEYIKAPQSDLDPVPANLSPEEAALNPVISKIIEQRTVVLEAAVERIYQKILDNVENIPYGIRWICSRVRELTLQKWPESTPIEINSLVGGLCFLRYISPAVATPTQFKVVTGVDVSDRKFTPIAKILQCLSNGTQCREDFMKPLNAFLERATPKLQNFFDQLCDVESIDEHLRLELLASIEKPIQSVMFQLGDIYFLHSNLYKFKEEVPGLNKGDNELRLLLHKLGIPPQIQNDNSAIFSIGSSWHQSSYQLPPAPEELEGFSDVKNSFVKLLTLLDPIVDSNTRFITLLMNLKEANLENPAITQSITDLIIGVARLVSEHPASFPTAEHTLVALSRDVSRSTDLKVRLNRKIFLAKKVLDDIQVIRKSLHKTLAQHKQYLQNVEQQVKIESSTSEKKFTHQQLVQNYVIIESRLPLHVRERIRFLFSTNDCLKFSITAQYHGIFVVVIDLDLKDLLSKYANHEEQIRVEELTISVTMLLQFLNTQFIIKGMKNGKKKSDRSRQNQTQRSMVIPQKSRTYDS